MGQGYGKKLIARAAGKSLTRVPIFTFLILLVIKIHSVKGGSRYLKQLIFFIYLLKRSGARINGAISDLNNPAQSFSWHVPSLFCSFFVVPLFIFHDHWRCGSSPGFLLVK
jgi:hypothetical protein